MSIRDSPPPYDTNIPVVTSAGGTTGAYKDPNSPESLMKKTATLSAQATVDSTYDVKEGFKRLNIRKRSRNSILAFVFFLLLLLYTVQDRFRKYKLVFWFVFALFVFLLFRFLLRRE